MLTLLTIFAASLIAVPVFLPVVKGASLSPFLIIIATAFPVAVALSFARDIIVGSFSKISSRTRTLILSFILISILILSLPFIILWFGKDVLALLSLTLGAIFTLAIIDAFAVLPFLPQPWRPGVFILSPSLTYTLLALLYHDKRLLYFLPILLFICIFALAFWNPPAQSRKRSFFFVGMIAIAIGLYGLFVFLHQLSKIS